MGTSDRPVDQGFFDAVDWLLNNVDPDDYVLRFWAIADGVIKPSEAELMTKEQIKARAKRKGIEL